MNNDQTMFQHEDIVNSFEHYFGDWRKWCGHAGMDIDDTYDYNRVLDLLKNGLSFTDISKMYERLVEAKILNDWPPCAE